jgi:hypothetical protein
MSNMSIRPGAGSRSGSGPGVTGLVPQVTTVRRPKQGS